MHFANFANSPMITYVKGNCNSTIRSKDTWQESCNVSVTLSHSFQVVGDQARLCIADELPRSSRFNTGCASTGSCSKRER